MPDTTQAKENLTVYLKKIRNTNIILHLAKCLILLFIILLLSLPLIKFAFPFDDVYVSFWQFVFVNNKSEVNITNLSLLYYMADFYNIPFEDYTNIIQSSLISVVNNSQNFNEFIATITTILNHILNFFTNFGLIVLLVFLPVFFILSVVRFFKYICSNKALENINNDILFECKSEVGYDERLKGRSTKSLRKICTRKIIIYTLFFVIPALLLPYRLSIFLTQYQIVSVNIFCIIILPTLFSITLLVLVTLSTVFKHNNSGAINALYIVKKANKTN